MSEKRRCTATRADGERCGAWVVAGKRVLGGHDIESQQNLLPAPAREEEQGEPEQQWQAARKRHSFVHPLKFFSLHALKFSPEAFKYSLKGALPVCRPQVTSHFGVVLLSAVVRALRR